MFLTADRVSYTYNRRTGVEPVNAVREISVRIARGSLTGLIGPNGCGKTTLLKLLAGVLMPDSGTIALDGRALTTMSRRYVARRIAVVPQETHPAFEYSVLEMALMGRHPHLGPFQLEGPADLAIARESLEATGTLQLAERSYMALRAARNSGSSSPARSRKRRKCCCSTSRLLRSISDISSRSAC